jgi:hypothetical protein
MRNTTKSHVHRGTGTRATVIYNYADVGLVYIICIHMLAYNEAKNGNSYANNTGIYFKHFR